MSLAQPSAGGVIGCADSSRVSTRKPQAAPIMKSRASSEGGSFTVSAMPILATPSSMSMTMRVPGESCTQELQAVMRIRVTGIDDQNVFTCRLEGVGSLDRCGMQNLCERILAQYFGLDAFPHELKRTHNDEAPPEPGLSSAYCTQFQITHLTTQILLTMCF